jgi:hypothetical protein
LQEGDDCSSLLREQKVVRGKRRLIMSGRVRARGTKGRAALVDVDETSEGVGSRADSSSVPCRSKAVRTLAEWTGRLIDSGIRRGGDVVRRSCAIIERLGRRQAWLEACVWCANWGSRRRAAKGHTYVRSIMHHSGRNGRAHRSKGPDSFQEPKTKLLST